MFWIGEWQGWGTPVTNRLSAGISAPVAPPLYTTWKLRELLGSAGKYGLPPKGGCYGRGVWLRLSFQYGIKKREVAEEEAQAAMEATEGSLTRPKQAVPKGCGDAEEEEESIMDSVMKYLPGPLQDMFKK